MNRLAFSMFSCLDFAVCFFSHRSLVSPFARRGLVASSCAANSTAHLSECARQSEAATVPCRSTRVALPGDHSHPGWSPRNGTSAPQDGALTCVFNHRAHASRYSLAASHAEPSNFPAVALMRMLHFAVAPKRVVKAPGVALSRLLPRT